MTATSDAGPSPEFRCDAWARALPRVVAACIVIAAGFAAYRIDQRVFAFGSGYVAIALMVLGALFALGALRTSGELRQRVGLGARRIVVAYRHTTLELAFDDVDTLYFRSPFAGSRHWLPAMVLLDRRGHEWRVSALTLSGNRFVEELLDRMDRSDLRAWAAELAIVRRMARPRLWTAIGYATALAFPGASAILFLR